MSSFLLVIAAILSLNYEVRFRVNLAILDANYFDAKGRQQALQQIKAVGGLGDPRLQAHYKKALDWDKDGFAKSLVREICSEQFFNKQLFTIMVERSASRLETLESMYAVRSHWWHDPVIVDKMRSIVKKSYEQVYDKKSTDLEHRDAWLSFWAGMIHVRAQTGDMAIKPICIAALKDKREIRVLDRLSDVPHLPAESRVCDYALTALLVLHQTDQKVFFSEYDYQQVGWINYGTEIRKVFDRAIADYPRIARKYFDEK